MAMGPEVEIAVDAAPPQAAVSWGAIFAGTVCAAGLTLLLMVLGSASFSARLAVAGRGCRRRHPRHRRDHLAGNHPVALLRHQRLRHHQLRAPTSPDIQADETFFRNSATGLAVWATATLIVVAILGSVAASVVGAGTRAAATVASGVAEGAGDAAASLADPTAYVVDTMFRSGEASAAATAPDAAAAPAASAAPRAPATPDATAASPAALDAATPASPDATTAPAPAAPATAAAPRRCRVSRRRRFDAGRRPRSDADRGDPHPRPRPCRRDLPEADKTYLEDLVSRTAGIGEEEATARIDQAIGALNAAKTEAMATAEAAEGGGHGRAPRRAGALRRRLHGLRRRGARRLRPGCALHQSRHDRPPDRHAHGRRRRLTDRRRPDTYEGRGTPAAFRFFRAGL